KLMFVIGNGYISTAVYDELSASEKAKWTETGIGYGYDYIRNPQVQTNSVPEMRDYHVFVEVISATGSVDSSKWVNFEGYKTVWGFVSAANLAFKADGLEKLVTSSANGSSISVKYDGSGNTHSCYSNDGKWVHVEDTGLRYTESDSITFAVVHGFIGTDVYNAMSDDDKKGWESSGMSYAGYEYQRVPSESVTGYKSDDDKNNLPLYIGIGVGAVVIVGIVAFLFLRKK
ncbi:MAG: hypothetical protein J6Z24_02295, partial [Oscillospiraceae bacterium]|nr:hypothetical protein [Oscillospiraceae bacterium]